MRCKECHRPLERDDQGTLIDNTGGDVCAITGANDVHTVSAHEWVSAKHLGYEDEVWCKHCGHFAYSPTEGDRDFRCEVEGGLSETLGGTL